MNKWIARVGATVSLAAVVATMALADTAKTAPAKAPTCPVCHMALTTKKTKDNTVAVKGANGKTLYCCSKCDMKPKKK